jgi:hypothetical protein
MARFQLIKIGELDLDRAVKDRAAASRRDDHGGVPAPFSERGYAKAAMVAQRCA